LIGEFSGPILDSTIDFPDYDFVHIVCYKSTAYDVKSKNEKFKREDPDIIHDEIIPLIPRIEKRSDSGAPNVLLLSIDSISFVNFRRLFTKTAKLLTEHKFIELKGYTKVGLNTIPNIIPLLTGYHSHELLKGQDGSHSTHDWPIIWKNYSDDGFVTFFDEEWPEYGLFRETKDYTKYETDYDTRPFHYEIYYNKHDLCYLDRTEAQVSLYSGKV
jgi:hypothetical protein